MDIYIAENGELTKVRYKDCISNGDVVISSSEREIIEKYCDTYDLPVKDVLSRSRKKIYQQVRRLIVRDLRDRLGRTYQRIGDIFWWRNHASIMYFYKN